ncbi:MAG: hypothetical protein ACXV5I_06055 [Halobacteriota archaeon]
MASSFTTMTEVDRAVAAIKQIMERSDKLPPVLVAAYRETLAAASSDIVRRFFEGLAAQCPEALQYFIDVETKKAQEEAESKLDTIT